MGRALEASITTTVNSVLAAVGASTQSADGGTAAQSAGGGGGGGGAGVPIPLSAETPAEAMAAAALIDVLLQLFPPGGSSAASPAQHGPVLSLAAPALRAMAALLAHPAVPSAGLNVKIINIYEAFLEVLGRLWLVSPSTFPELFAGLDAVTSGAASSSISQDSPGSSRESGGGSAVDRLLDRWLTIASARFLEEVVGAWFNYKSTIAGISMFRE